MAGFGKYFLPSSSKRYQVFTQYFGPAFHGWQRNPGICSVEGTISDALAKVLEKDKNSMYDIYGSSRTDAGVHAIRNACHIQINRQPEPQGKPHLSASSLRNALNSHLREFPVRILDVHERNRSFHARHDAIERSYCYRILQPSEGICGHSSHFPPIFENQTAWCLKSRLNIDAMVEAAKFLVGTHDFSSFRNAGCQVC